ncbi:MAG TPA: hypothetical protein VHR66_22270 [Gemmataceae bacterium]|jgi:hypothetical protein|nr:hypothetical protein [Gemmataceae bacterium]
MSRFHLAWVAAAILIIPAAVRAGDEDAKSILIKAIKAHGGEEFLTKHQAGQSKSTGKLTLAGVGEVNYTQENAYMLPDKFKEDLELDIAGQKVKVVTLVNGDKMSVTANGMEAPLDATTKGALEHARYMMKVARMTALVKEKGYELSLTGEIKVGDKPAVGIRVSSKGQKDITLYFDKETGLLAKLEHRAAEAGTGNEVTEERIVVEYKKNDAGIPLPKKLVIKHDGKDFLVADVVEAKMLEKLDDSFFSK